MIQQTSKDAYSDIKESTELTQTEKIFNIICRMEGSTINQVKRIMQIESGTASARIRKLVQEGRIFDSGRTHQDKLTGKTNIVWECVYGQGVLF